MSDVIDALASVYVLIMFSANLKSNSKSFFIDYCAQTKLDLPRRRRAAIFHWLFHQVTEIVELCVGGRDSRITLTHPLAIPIWRRHHWGWLRGWWHHGRPRRKRRHMWNVESGLVSRGSLGHSGVKVAACVNVAAAVEIRGFCVWPGNEWWLDNLKSEWKILCS